MRRFVDVLPPNAAVLDLGCGGGEPIAAWLRVRGLAVTGLDLSETMLALARARHPEGDWRRGDMRTLDLPERFDGIVAWDSFFHLTPAEQPPALAQMATHLRRGGTLLTTVGPRAGEATGTVGGASIYHASLSPAGYAAALEAAGLRMTRFVAEDPEADRHSVLMAVREG
ncbi:class I SAM-dependent methyltransferase [Hasllibacter halocynthiae]|uniref:class I SAM-dependent methyltransferase n=1 Tax=Hasllibacter halocynthiae TaxID=595589 RepID=UPI002481E0F1|nr:class I SAM-dependent methyltransferase [Hasllibacter halocynthiae]